MEDIVLLYYLSAPALLEKTGWEDFKLSKFIVRAFDIKTGSDLLFQHDGPDPACDFLGCLLLRSQINHDV